MKSILAIGLLFSMQAQAAHRCEKAVIKQTKEKLGVAATEVAINSIDKNAEILVFSLRIKGLSEGKTVSQLAKVNVSPDDCSFLGAPEIQADSQKAE